MRLALRFALSASILLILILLLVKIKLQDIWDQYGVSTYLTHTWKNTFQHGPVQNIPTFGGAEASDKVVIMAKTEKENTDWVAENLPEYVLPIARGSTYFHHVSQAIHYITYIVCFLMKSSLVGKQQSTPSTLPPPIIQPPLPSSQPP